LTAETGLVDGQHDRTVRLTLVEHIGQAAEVAGSGRERVDEISHLPVGSSAPEISHH
jgi:hypothetical protein